MTRRTVVITGGSGLLALNWAVAQREHFRVVLCQHQRTVRLKGTEVAHVALDSVNSLRETLQRVRPWAVVHAAGLTSVEGCESDPTAARVANVDLAANVAEAAAESGCRLVHISTDHLFGGRLPLASESDSLDPLNVYAATKAKAEQKVIAADPAALVVRTNFYGWGPSYRRSFSDQIILTLRAGSSVRLFDDVFYTPILVESLVRATHELLEGGAAGIYNVVANERISKYDFGRMLAERFGLGKDRIERGKLAEQSGLVRRPLDMSLSGRKTAEFLARPLATVAQDIDRLWRQERDGIAAELGKL